MSINVKLIPEKTTLKIGVDYANENTIEFKIELAGDEPVFLRLQIPVGENGVLYQIEDSNQISVRTIEYLDRQPKVVNEDTQDKKVWSLGDTRAGVEVNGSTTLSVSISNIFCRANVGESDIEVVGVTKKSPKKQSTATLRIKKKKPAEWKNPILYFIAEPNFLLSGEKVTLRWDVAGPAGQVSLDFRGGPVTTDSDGNPITLESGMKVKPDADGIYILKFGGRQREQSVQVLGESKWHKSQLRLGPSFPMVIFDGADKFKETDKLYAIFALLAKGDNNRTVRTPVLCESANGIAGWGKCENLGLRADMASSPGVQLSNRLYLIGGSSVDWDQTSRTICYYDLKDRNKGWRDATVTFDGDFEERMGHACVIVNDKIWVMGGSGRYGMSLNDVWELTIDHSSDPIKIDAKQIEKSVSANTKDPNWEKRWAPRCMFSAVHYNNQIWVFGGVDSPQGSTLDGIYYRGVASEDKEWKLRPDSQKANVVKDAIGTGVARCGDRLFLVITDATKLATQESGTVMRQLEKSTTTLDSWVIRNPPPRPAEWTVSNHSITLVAFNNRLYLRYLDRDALRWDLEKQKKEPPGSLQVYIR